MHRFGLALCLVLMALGAGATVARADVVIGTGGVAVTASADARCSDPPAGDVEAPFDGDDTAPWSAGVTADVSVPCQGSQHTATASASADGDVSTGPFGTVINADGAASASVSNGHSADANAEFTLDFSTDEPVTYVLTVTGNVMFNGGLTGDASGTLQPGGYTIRGFTQCSAGGAVASCPGNGFSITLELGVPEDTDGDALFDVWETDGIDEDGDGTPELDLPAMGADPERKDIFLEIDHMPGHALSQTAVDRVVAAFAAAPVSNPDGSSGITLHVDNGPASRMDPATGAAWGALSDADALPTHDPVLGTMSASNPREYDWSAFDLLKADHFLPERASAFHYLISGHRFGSATIDSSGISREIGASDLIVTLGPVFEPQESSGTVAQQAGTIMHELGHNLGLTHGGDDHGTYEPNRLSVMNYAFQFTGIPRVDGTDVLDYARLAVPLDEANLDEGIGFGFAAGTQPAEWLTIYRCQDLTRRWAYLQAAQTDWNCDGTPQGLVARDFNRDGVFSNLAPYQDWPNLVYHGGAIGGAGAAPPDLTEVTEPDVQELIENAAEVQRAHADVAAAKPAPPAGGGPGGNVAPPADDPPVISGLSLSPRSFKAAPRGGSTGRRGGAALRFRASSAGFVRFTVVRALPGRRVRGRCVRPRRGVRGRRCTRLAPVRGSFVLPAAAGANSTRFTGRLRGGALAAGDYRLVATPLSAGARRPGTARAAAFRILRRGR